VTLPTLNVTEPTLLLARVSLVTRHVPPVPVVQLFDEPGANDPLTVAPQTALPAASTTAMVTVARQVLRLTLLAVPDRSATCIVSLGGGVVIHE